jgi:hypothetical protein
MGDPAGDLPLVNQTAFEYTSTRSIFTLSAGPVEMKVTFLSGITPKDLLRSSLPYSYLDVEVHSTDGSEHSVNVYSDISAEWVSGDRSAVVEWQYGNIPASSGGAPELFNPPATAEPVTPVGSVFGTQTAFDVPAAVSQSTVPIPDNGLIQYSNASVNARAEESSIDIVYHKVYRQQQLEFSQVEEQAEWGYWYAFVFCT